MAGTCPRSLGEVLDHKRCHLKQSMLAAGMICFNVASGLITRPLFKEFFLMYTHNFLVTSVRGIDLPPQMAANAGLSVFGAKMPTPFFFMAKAFFLPVAD